MFLDNFNKCNLLLFDDKPVGDCCPVGVADCATTAAGVDADCAATTGGVTDDRKLDADCATTDDAGVDADDRKLDDSGASGVVGIDEEALDDAGVDAADEEELNDADVETVGAGGADEEELGFGTCFPCAADEAIGTFSTNDLLASLFSLGLFFLLVIKVSFSSTSLINFFK